jgi:hypothetical protein
LQELSDCLPEILKTVLEVKGKFIRTKSTPEIPYRVSEYLASFEAVSTNFDIAKEKINSGVTNPNQIFAEKPEVVVSAWQGFEAKRKTMTYLPYKY